MGIPVGFTREGAHPGGPHRRIHCELPGPADHRTGHAQAKSKPTRGARLWLRWAMKPPQAMLCRKGSAEGEGDRPVRTMADRGGSRTMVWARTTASRTTVDHFHPSRPHHLPSLLLSLLSSPPHRTAPDPPTSLRRPASTARASDPARVPPGRILRSLAAAAGSLSFVLFSYIYIYIYIW